MSNFQGPFRMKVFFGWLFTFCSWLILEVKAAQLQNELKTQVFKSWRIHVDYQKNNTFEPLFPAHLLETNTNDEIFKNLVEQRVNFAIVQDRLSMNGLYDKQYVGNYCINFELSGDLESFDMTMLQLVRFLRYVLFIHILFRFMLLHLSTRSFMV